MALTICRNSDELIEAMANKPNAVYSTFSSDTLPLQKILAIGNTAKLYNCREVTKLSGYKQVTLKRVKKLFNKAYEFDKEQNYNFSSKVPLSIKNIEDINKILFIDYLLEHKPDDHYLFLFNAKDIEKLFTEVINRQNRPVKKVLPTFKACGRAVRTLLRVVLNKAEDRRSRIVFYSLRTGIFNNKPDTYFGILPEKIKESTIVYLVSGKQICLPHIESQIPLEAFAVWHDVITAFVTTVFECLFRKHVNGDGISKSDSLYDNIIEYMKESELQSGEFFMLQFCNCAYRRMFEQLQPETLVLPFENRSWEKLLLRSAKLSKVSKCIGYQHSSLTNRHLAFELDDNETLKAYLPDSIITVGNVTANYLKELSPIYNDRLIVGGSLRRVDISEEHSIPAPSVLIAVSSSFSEALRLLILLNDCCTMIDVPVIIRTHPTIPIKQLFDSFDWPDNISLSEGKTLTEDLLAVSLVAYSSSTVSLEGMLYGRLPVFIDIDDVPVGDPILGECTLKYVVNRETSLVDVINDYKSLDNKRCNERSDKAILYATNYLQKVDMNKSDLMVDLITK